MADPRLEDYASVAVPDDPAIHDCEVECEGASHRGEITGMVVNFIEEGIRVRTVEQLGKGGFGVVYKARTDTGQSYALKVSKENLSEAEWRRLREEVAIMQLLAHHPNIVQIVTAAKDHQKAFILMERCHHLSLSDVLSSRRLTIAEILWVGHTLLTFVEYMHSKDCIHRDLKPSNLLFDFDGNLKVTDFGLSTRTKGEPRKSVVGTTLYMVPEMAGQVYNYYTKKEKGGDKYYGPEVDVWSIGITLFAMLTGRLPYESVTSGIRHLEKKEQHTRLLEAVANMNWQWPADFAFDSNPELIGLVEGILHKDVRKRATLKSVLSSPVWSKRPVKCPSSLMKVLSLLKDIKTPSRGGGGETPNRRGPSARLSEFATPAAHRAKMTEEEYHAHVVQCLEMAEEEERDELLAEHDQALAVFITIDSDLLIRRETLNEEKEGRDQIRALYTKGPQRIVAPRQAYEPPQSSIYQRAASRVRQPSVTDDTLMVSNGSTTLNVSLMTPNIRSQFQRGSSQPMISGSFKVVLSPEKTPRAGSTMGRIVRAPSTDGHSPNLYIEYEGRANSTKWGLRERVKVAEEISDLITPQHKCLNGHTMEVHHRIPARFDGIYCNACNKYFSHVTRTPVCLYRCGRCDFDICLSCANAKKEITNLIECPTCTKKFVTKAKMQTHSNTCRGPSTTRASASPARSNGRNASPKGHSGRKSILDNLPPTMTSADRKGKSSSAAVISAATPNSSFSVDGSGSPDFRNSTNSLFEAARPTNFGFGEDDNPSLIVVDTFVAGAEEGARRRRSVSSKGGPTKRAVFEGDLPAVTTTAAVGGKRPRAQLVDMEDSITVPAEVATKAKGTSRSVSRVGSVAEVSVAVDRSHEDDEEDEAPRKGRRTEKPTSMAPPAAVASPASPKGAKTKSTPQRAAGGPSPAQDSATRKQQPSPVGGAQTITFNLAGAEKPLEGSRQLSLSRKQPNAQTNSVLNTAISADDEKRKLLEVEKARNGASVPPAAAASHRSVSPSLGRSKAQLPPSLSGLVTGQQSRVSSLPNNANVINYSVSRPSASPTANLDALRPSTMDGVGRMASRAGGPQYAQQLVPMHQPSASHQPAYAPFDSHRLMQPNHAYQSNQYQQQPYQQAYMNEMGQPPQGGYPLMGYAPQMNYAPQMPQPQQIGPGRAQAFLGLPQDLNNRRQFADNFLAGPWVRSFSLQTTGQSDLLYYSIQPGRFGCLFAAGASTGTIIADIHSRLVLVVPEFRPDDSAPRDRDDAHVTSFYDDDIHIISLEEALLHYEVFIKGILAYARRILQAESDNTWAANTMYSTHMYSPNSTSVSKETKFTYLRKVYPDPNNTLWMFRLSSLRSQIFTNCQVEVRWHSDRARNVGAKYYVYADGTLSPMTDDIYGILRRFENLLSNAFRR